MNKYFENNSYFSEISSIFWRFLGKILRHSLIAYISVQDKARNLKFLQVLDKTHKNCLSTFGIHWNHSFQKITTFRKNGFDVFELWFFERIFKTRQNF